MNPIFHLDSEKTTDTFNSIFSKYGLSVEAISDLFNDDELYLGGSTVVKTYCDEMSIPIKDFTPSDIDFFVTTEEAYNKIVTLISGTSGYKVSYSHSNTKYAYMRNIRRVCEYIKYEHAGWGYRHKKVQVCLLDSDNFNNIFDSMDVTATKCLYDGIQYVMHADFVRDIPRLEFTIPSCVQSIGELEKVMHRVDKYERRGFSCTYPEKITMTVSPKVYMTFGYPAITKKYFFDHWDGFFYLKKDVPTGYGQYSLLISEIKRLTDAGKQKDVEKIAELQKLVDKLKDDLALKGIELSDLKKIHDKTKDDLVEMTAKAVVSSAAQGVLTREVEKLKDEHESAISSLKEYASIVNNQQNEISQLTRKISTIANFVASSD